MKVDTSYPLNDEPVSTALPGAKSALLLLLSINLFNYIDRFILAAVEEEIAKEYGASAFQMGWLATAFLLTYMLISPIFGWLADHWRRWAIVGIGVILWSLASGASGLTYGYTFLLVMRCMIGVGEAAYGPVAPTLISDLYPVNVRGKVLAWFYCAIPFGGALGFAIGGFFKGHWHWAFYLTLPPGLLLGLLCLLKREPPRGEIEHHAEKKRASFQDYVALSRIPSYVICTIGMTLMTFAIGGISFWMPRYLGAQASLKGQNVSLTFGIITAVMGLSATLVGGWLGDKLRPRFPGSYFMVSAGGMLVGTPLFLAHLYAPFPAAWFLLAAAVFCLFLNTGPANTVLANVTPPRVRATAFALNIFIIHALGDAISPPLLGWISEHFSMRTGFVTVSIMMALGGAVWLLGIKYLAQDTEGVGARVDDVGFDVIPKSQPQS